MLLIFCKLLYLLVLAIEAMAYDTMWIADLPAVLLFVLWYCHKEAGRCVSTVKAVDGSSRVEELPDDPALPAAEAHDEHAGRQNPIIIEPDSDVTASGPRLPPPPIGADRHD